MASNDFVWMAWIAVIAYAAVILYFVIRGARKTTSIEDYAVGSFAFSPWAVGLALAASMTSAATFIINPGFIAYYGISGFISLGIVFAFSAVISLIVLTKSFRKIGQSVKALTMAQWIGTRYNSSAYAFFFGLLSLLLITFIVLICVGLTKLLSTALNVGEIYILAGIIVFVFGYMMFGGANSMVYTNMIQALMMIVVAIILLTSGFDHFSDGVVGFLAKLKAIDPNLVGMTNDASPLFRDFYEIIFCQIIVGVAVVCQPHIITKSLLLKDDKQVNQYLIVGVIVEILFFLVVFAGLFARLEFPDLTLNGEAIALDGMLSTYVVARFPVFVGLILVMGLISAGLSTLEGLIQSLSTTISADVLHVIAPKSKKLGVKLNRWVILGLSIVSFIFSYQQLVAPDLSVGIFAQNGVYAYFSAAFIPVLFGMYCKEVPAWIPFSSSLAAIITHFSIYYGRIGEYMQDAIRNPAIASSTAILVSLLVGLAGIFIYQRSNQKKLAHT
jgi:sodium/pantothenate symporter